MTTAAEISTDRDKDWVERFVSDGYAIIPKVARTATCEAALDAVRHHLDDWRPLDQWTFDAPGRHYDVIEQSTYAAIDCIWEEPGLHAALDALFSPGQYLLAPPGEKPHLSLWVNPFDEQAVPRLLPLGHIDSGDFYRGISVQIALVTTEPFGGNTSFFPGIHREIEKRWLSLGGGEQCGGSYLDVRRRLPAVEFIAEAGDAVLCHHATCHTGNPSHGENRLPRISVRFEVFSERQPMGRAVPNDGSAWARSYG
jgi:hypothetical protein